MTKAQGFWDVVERFYKNTPPKGSTTKQVGRVIRVLFDDGSALDISLSHRTKAGLCPTCNGDGVLEVGCCEYDIYSTCPDCMPTAVQQDRVNRLNSGDRI